MTLFRTFQFFLYDDNHSSGRPSNIFWTRLFLQPLPYPLFHFFLWGGRSVLSIALVITCDMPGSGFDPLCWTCTPSDRLCLPGLCLFPTSLLLFVLPWASKVILLYDSPDDRVMTCLTVTAAMEWNLFHSMCWQGRDGIAHGLTCWALLIAH